MLLPLRTVYSASRSSCITSTSQWRVLAAAGAAAVGTCISITGTKCDAPSAASSGGSGDVSFTERVQGEYEDRLRSFSSPQRTFEYFASVVTEKGTYMTVADFARALTPYQRKPGVELGSKNFKFNYQAKHLAPSEASLSAYLKVLENIVGVKKPTKEALQASLDQKSSLGIDAAGHLWALEQLNMTSAQYDQLLVDAGLAEPKSPFFAMVDMDGDGLISYPEYMLFHTLLATPDHMLTLAFRMFDQDLSGEVDLNEFSAFMKVLRAGTNAGRAEVPEGRTGSSEVASMKTYAALFKGKQSLSLEDFLSFARQLQTEVLRMQFSAWDVDGSGTLDGVEFAQFLVSLLAHNKHVQTDLRSRLDGKPVQSLIRVSISSQDFIDFSRFLNHLDAMECAMRVVGTKDGLTLSEFQHAARAVCSVHGGENAGGVSPAAAEVLFALFDKDDDGRLNSDEFIKVMQEQKQAQDPSRELGVVDLLTRVAKCATREIKMLM